MKPKSPGKPQQRTKSAYEPRSLFRNINASTLQRTETILILIDVGAQAFVVVLMPKSYFVPVPDDSTPTEERVFAKMDAAVNARYVSSGAMVVYLLALVLRLRGLRSAALRSRSDRADFFVLLLLLVGLVARWYPEYEVTSDIKQYEFAISLGYLCLLALHFIVKPDSRTLSKKLDKMRITSNGDHIQISIESSDASFERKPSTAPTAFTAPASQHANTLFGDVQLYTAEDIPEVVKLIIQQDKHTALKPPKHLDQEEIYEQVLITGELRAELWAIETKKLERQLRALNKTSQTVSNELNKLNTQRVELEADRGKLMEEEEHYWAMIEQLKMQESSPRYLDKGPTKWNHRGSTSRTMRGTHKRWCEIGSDGRLRFHKCPGDTEVLGEIDLADASFEIKCDDDKEFVLCTSDQQTRFFTKNTGELHIWVRALLAANLYLQTKKDLDAIADELDAAERRQEL